VHRVHADLVGGDHVGPEVVQKDHLVGADAEPLAGAVRRPPRQRGPDPRPAPPADLTKTLGLTQAQLDTAQTINRLHRLLMDLIPGGARRNLTAKRAAALLATVTPASQPAVTRHQLAAELIADVRQLEQRIAEVETRIKAGVAQANTSLLELFGVGPVLAATFLGAVGDIGRFPSRHHFAAHTGTAPLEASSGQVIRHRLSRAGDRKLNHALYMMAMVQVRRPSPGQAYYRRKLAEGKSPKEALRCLKRRLSDAVYRCLVADQRLPPSLVGLRPL
jgi:transposase